MQNIWRDKQQKEQAKREEYGACLDRVGWGGSTALVFGLATASEPMKTGLAAKSESVWFSTKFLDLFRRGKHGEHILDLFLLW